jgi:electron transfer flavoprotein beta subunit
LRILVAMKQVPDTAEVRIDPERGTLIRDGVPSIMNPFDAYALEEGLRWRDSLGGEVIAVTMGPPQAEAILREAVSMGADSAVLLSDRAFAGADTWATSHTLAAAVRKLGSIDLVITGKQAIDGDTAQTGPGIAASLDWPQITFVGKVRELDSSSIVAERSVEGGIEVLECPLPAVLTILKDANVPRMPSLRGKMKARTVEILRWGRTDLGLSEEETGLEGSPTRVVRIATPESRAGGSVHAGTAEELAVILADLLLGRQEQG